MSKRFRLLVIAVAVLAVSLAAGTAGYFTAVNNSRPAAQAEVNTQVRLYANKAEPDATAVRVGHTVEFASADSASHSLSLGGGTHGLETGQADDGHGHQHVGDFSSGEFKNDEAWRATFNKPGTYTFHDHLHPGVRVTVVVYQPNNGSMIK